MKLTKKIIIICSILLILGTLLIVYLVIPFAKMTIDRISSIKYRPNEGVWISTDHSAYIDMNCIDSHGWDKGKIMIAGKIHSIQIWFIPKSSGAYVYEESETSPELIDETYTYWRIKYKKDHFTITVTESSFMKVGTKLTFYRAENDTLPEDFLESQYS